MHFDSHDFIRSADGTTIGYQTVGSGPGLILLHGAMQTSASFGRLANALKENFTVYVPDRRGRGLSGPVGEHYGMHREVEDVSALIERTGASRVFGLSSGALIALQAGLVLPPIRKLAVYEPPLVIEGAPSPLTWVPKYEAAMANGNMARAMVAGMRGTGEKSFFTKLPDWVLVPLMRLILRKNARRHKAGGTSLETLVRLVHYDAALALEMAGTLEKFRKLQPEVLLLGGANSADFLKAGLDALAQTLPKVRRVELPGVGHLGPIETPEAVAAQLKEFMGMV